MRVWIALLLLFMSGGTAAAQSQPPETLPYDLGLTQTMSSGKSPTLDLALPGRRLPGAIQSDTYTFRTKLYQNGPHEVVLEGGSQSGLARLPGGASQPFQEMNSTLTYRYKGFLGGVVRPVVRMTAGSGRTPLPGSLGLGPSYGYLSPEAGVELVYKGYGIGMTMGYPLAKSFGAPSQPNPGGNPRQVYVPIPAKSVRHPGFGWDRLFDQMSKNLYFVVDDGK